MELSFWTKIGLQLIVAVLGMVAVVYSYLGLLVGTIVIALVCFEVKTYNADKTDFREKLAGDSVSYMERLLSRPFDSHPSHMVWSSKDEQFKSDALGRVAYDLLKKFYDCVMAREGYLGSRSGFDPVIRTLNEDCYSNFLEVCAKVSWFRELQHVRIDDLIARRKEVSLG